MAKMMMKEEEMGMKKEALTNMANKRGGGKWISSAIKKPGALRMRLGIKAGKKIPAGKLAPKGTDTTLMKRRKALAKTLRKIASK